MRTVFILLTGCCVGFACSMWAQETEPDIGKYISMIEGGQADQVRGELPSLLVRYPNSPAVLYLMALTTTEGAEAVRMYQSIVDNFPRSEWADDALFRVYQFYYAIGMYRTAEMKMTQLRKEYPTSTYARESPDQETKGLPEEKGELLTGEQAAEGDTSRTGLAQAKFTLQVGAYTALVNAEKQKLFFEDLGYPVEVINKVKDGRSLYIVLVGTYITHEDARAKAAEFKRSYNIDSIVVLR